MVLSVPTNLSVLAPLCEEQGGDHEEPQDTSRERSEHKNVPVEIRQPGMERRTIHADTSSTTEYYVLVPQQNL